ncbi:fimbrial protein [Phytobacter sp. AG2a]
MKNHGRSWLLLAALYCFFSPAAQADCELNQGTGFITGLKSYTIPLSGITISVPPDTPVGNEIYRFQIKFANQGWVYVKCTSSGQFYESYDYLTTPLLPSDYSTAVYKTGVPGIGVKFVRGNSYRDFPLKTAVSCIGKTCNYPSSGWDADSRVVLIKTADVVTAGTIEGSKLPTALYSVGQNDSMLGVYAVSLSGSMQITSPTCNITAASKTMTVNMGKHQITAFTGKGTATEWKNASIQLANCGRFYGNTPSGYSAGTFDGSSTFVLSDDPTSNFLTITLTPLNGSEDAAKGIMKIADHPLKATGIGIQLSTSESTSGLVNLASPTLQTLPKDGRQVITVPLYARYIQTENNAIAGKANGRLEYTITYQ